MVAKARLDTADILRGLRSREPDASVGTERRNRNVTRQSLDDLTADDVQNMDDESADTTIQSASERIEGTLIRTYRHLRLVLVAAAPAILIAIAAVWNSGYGSLPSISHYYYTPARIIFVGALVTASATLLALSGRGSQRGWLDLAALFAPLIALVPTRIGNDEVKGFEEACPDGTECIPDDAMALIATGMLVWFVFAVLVLVYAVISGIATMTGRDAITPPEVTSPYAIWIPTIAGAIIVGIYAVFWIWFRPEFFDGAHFISASVFFVIITIVALNKVRRDEIELPERGPAWLWRRILCEFRWVPRIFRTVFGWIALLMAIDIIAAVLILWFGWREPLVIGGLSFGTIFLVEAAALVLFTLFWAVETKRKWNEADPE